MKKLGGKISDRIRSGELPEDVHVAEKLPAADNSPRSASIRHGKGRALGRPSRSDRNADTSGR